MAALTLHRKMKIFAVAIASLVLTVANTSGEDSEAKLLTWADLDAVLETPAAVEDGILRPRKATPTATKRFQVPEHRVVPRFDFELTLWKHGIPGLTIIARKIHKAPGNAEFGKMTLCYMAIDVDAYKKYLRAHDLELGGLLLFTPKDAMQHFPNLRNFQIPGEYKAEANSTVVLSQSLFEYGDDPTGFVRMEFVEGRLKSASFGRVNQRLTELLKPAGNGSE